MKKGPAKSKHMIAILLNNEAYWIPYAVFRRFLRLSELVSRGMS